MAVITGSTSGIGKGTALLFAREGARVVVAGRNREAGEEVVATIRESGGEAIYVPTDITVKADCQRLIQSAVDTWGRLDVLVNNAAIFPRGDIYDTSEELFDRIIAVNLKGPFFCCQAAIPVMKAQGGGVIINIGSINAYIGGSRLLIYSASKGALMTFTKNLARTHARDRIRVNLVNPGWVVTEGEHVIQQTQEGQPENWVEIHGPRQPFGRLLTPDDIARAILFLASDEAELINGAVLTVDQVPVQ